MTSVPTSISPELKKFYVEHHAKGPYGTSGAFWAQVVLDAIKLCKNQPPTILDFGAGKCTLEGRMSKYGVAVTNYDPCVPGIDILPDKTFDLVLSTDVAEHVEEHLLPAYIDELLSVSHDLLFLNIATRTSGLRLPDGRSAHVTVKDKRWWRDLFDARPELTFVSWSEPVGRPPGHSVNLTYRRT